MHHHDEHHHNHHHSHNSEESQDLKGRFAKRISHWKHHNEDHLESYREWAAKAEEMGYEKISELLKEICRKTEEQNEIFHKILEILEAR
ncbi:MAG: hypothetical protein WHS38_07845 [Thermodesulforhabdaceae bacterium]